MADPADQNDEERDDASPTGEASGDAKATATEDAASSSEKVAPAKNTDDSRKLGTDEIEKLLAEASDNLDEAVGGDSATGNPAGGLSSDPKPFNFGDLTADPSNQESQPIDLIGEVEMDLRVELGRTRMRLEEVLQLRSGSVVALDKLAGDPVDIFVNGRLIARGEVLVMNDNFCIRVTELVGA